jgi:hypothetical protein
VSCDMIVVPEGQHRIAEWDRFDPDWQAKTVKWLNDKLAVK